LLTYHNIYFYRNLMARIREAILGDRFDEFQKEFFVMLRFDILTIFPKSFSVVFAESIVKRAQEKKKVTIRVHDLRDYTMISTAKWMTVHLAVARAWS